MLEYLNLWFWSTWKFLMAPGVGWLSGMNFLQIWVCHTLGGYSSFLFFYYFSEFFMLRSERRKRKKREYAIATGKPYSSKSFTLLNKTIIRAKKWAFGYWIILFGSASFLSIPIGGIICAKFYPLKKRIVADSAIMIASVSAILTFIWKFVENL